MTLRKEKLENFKKELIERRGYLRRDLRETGPDWSADEEVYTDSIDQASAEMEKDFNLRLKNREQLELREIEVALHRIESGDFGRCEQCDQDISEARLKAYPLTTLCIDCKAELESEQGRFLNRA